MDLQEIKLVIYIFIYIMAFGLTCVNLYVLHKEHIQEKYKALYWMVVVQAIFFGLWILDTIKIYVELDYIGEARSDDIPFVLDFLSFLNMFVASIYSLVAYQATIKNDASINSKLRSVFVSNSVIFLIVSLIRLAENKKIVKIYKKIPHE